jgi:hypothetical protein
MSKVADEIPFLKIVYTLRNFGKPKDTAYY